jgi:alpha-L-arabinofuranosidase
LTDLGGNFCATYHWEDGVGPKDKRPSFPELAWGTVETNQFGTDEFMKWCKVMDTEPYLCLNFGTGTLDEALNWVDYCNGTKNTKYANMRRANGHEEPYNVKYWALGNEMWGDWQISQLTPEAYAEQALREYYCCLEDDANMEQNGPKHSNFSIPASNSSCAVPKVPTRGITKS